MRKTSVSLEEFSQWALLPENADRNFELINGEVIEVSPGRTTHSRVEHLISHVVLSYCEENDIPCYASGGDGAYAILGNVIAPDFAYKPTPMIDAYPDPEPPVWAVEIISPNDKGPDIRDKREIYRQAGILYWEIYPRARSVDVYAPGQPMRTVDFDGTLDGGDVLPGFTVPLSRLLAD